MLTPDDFDTQIQVEELPEYENYEFEKDHPEMFEQVLEKGEFVKVHPTPRALQNTYPAANWIDREQIVRLEEFAPNAGSLDVLNVTTENGTPESIYDFNITESAHKVAKVVKSDADAYRTMKTLVKRAPDFIGFGGVVNWLTQQVQGDNSFSIAEDIAVEEGY